MLRVEMPTALVSRDYFLKGFYNWYASCHIHSVDNCGFFLADVGTFKVFTFLLIYALYPCVWNGHYQNKIEV